MKLVIQIPCFNEAEQLPATLAELPKEVAGFEEVVVLVIDDGSTDQTSLVAREQGVEWLVRHRRNRGLAAAFATGLNAALNLGADVIVNTDADGQYLPAGIEKLVQPILEGKADLVIGDRRPDRNPNFPWHKRWLQRWGSRLVSWLAGDEIPDAVSGFRAFSREAALRMHVLTGFSYTIETVLEACHRGLAVHSVPIQIRSTSRPSRLFSSIPQFLWRSAIAMFTVQVRYRPHAVFLPIAAVLCGIGMLPMVRFVFLYMQGRGAGHVQSLVIGGALLLAGLLMFGLAVLAQLQSANRKLLEQLLELEGNKGKDRSNSIEEESL
jgi:glycosyltransferase involved in cell wall biosynthesis